MALTPLSNDAQGEFDFRRAGQGNGFHANVVCLEVEDDRAVIEVQVEQSTDPAYAPDEFVQGVAYDGGNGNGGPRNNDSFDLDESSSEDEADCDRGDEDLSRIRGDIVVQDGGFAAGP